ncbi:VOC family protein [Henriciella aquimarina]|uniref:VOC family protein n=1 Tax=Henriciella aquimarina TaxID=545261 RepID=UPI0009FEA5FC|nr:VOC family protein [Henriciella aquimarina]
MSNIIGVGGIFFLCEDPDATTAWYRDVLGVGMNEYGGFDFLHEASASAYPTGARTVFAPFQAGSDYFKPSNHDTMFNLMVDDLEAVLNRIEAAGVAQTQPRETYDYGKFAWIMDPDGRKVELWEPVESGL